MTQGIDDWPIPQEIDEWPASGVCNTRGSSSPPAEAAASGVAQDEIGVKRVPPRLPDDKRAAILADIQTGTKGRNQIARDHGVSVSTVTKVAKKSGSTDAFDRSQTENATRAAVADSRARRALLAADLLEDASKLRDRAWKAYSYYERGMGGPELVTLDLPPLKEVKEAYVALGVAVDKHVVLERHDATDPGMMGSLLGSLLDGLQRKHGTGDA